MKHKKPPKNSKLVKLVTIISISSVVVVFLFSFAVKLYLFPKNKPANSSDWESRYFSGDELKKYNGTNPKLPIYMGYEGKVYDVSAGAGFYAAGKTYNYLTGRDATAELNEVGVGEIIIRKYPVIGKIKN